jgi:hypothetical protein
MSGMLLTRLKSFVPVFFTFTKNAERPMTAGNISKNLSSAVKEPSILDPISFSNLEESADKFRELVRERNELIHAHVYSEPDGGQNLIFQIQRQD